MEHFYLGTHEQSWLKRTNVPLFMSRRRLKRMKSVYPATTRWCLDSGGFTELHLHGRWSFTADEYVADVREYMEVIGRLDWCAPMDWMCEPSVRATTGLTTTEHQERTIDSYLELHEQLDQLVIPVLQGWELRDYLAHVEMYDDAGVALSELPVVGIGSICRRDAATEITEVITRLHDLGLRMHAFGVKGEALRRIHPLVVSADSMAWSYRARRSEPLPGHTHKSCSNCLDFALSWRSRLLTSLKENGT